MANPVLVFLGLVGLLVVPGFALVKAVWPARRFDPFHRATTLFLSVVASVVLLTLVGSALGFMGRFFAGEIVGSMIAVTGLLAALAAWRGAFPRVLRRPAHEPGVRPRPTLADAGLHEAVAARARGDDARADAIERDMRRREYGR